MIELERVSRVYVKNGERICALREVSLTVAAGEYLSVIGPSGSGKTTLMNILGCLDRPTSGTYRLLRRDVGRLRPQEAAAVRGRHIGFVFQSFNLIPHMTACENVELPLVLRGEAARSRRERALAALERVGLAERSSHRPAELSGGQQQRVAIARVLAADPELILADEPTGNLDGVSVREIMEVLRELNREGRTLVMITHDMELAKRADRTLRMANGEII